MSLSLPRLHLLLLPLLLLALTSLYQQTSALPQDSGTVPACASRCGEWAAGFVNCTDPVCLCRSSVFILKDSICVQVNCTAEEAAIAGAWGIGYCQAVGVSLDPGYLGAPRTTTLSTSTTTTTPSSTLTSTPLPATAATGKHLSTGSSIGIGIGAAIAGMILLAGLAFLCWRVLSRRKMAAKNISEMDGDQQRKQGPETMELPAGFEGVEAPVGGRGYAGGGYAR